MVDFKRCWRGRSAIRMRDRRLRRPQAEEFRALGIWRYCSQAGLWPVGDAKAQTGVTRLRRLRARAHMPSCTAKAVAQSNVELGLRGAST
jgi:hypothetical protein